ncbi:MAG: hypothetical protein H6Q18_491 [Bacteroidetes bacterium]|nr:hypothetical protein [Bacteroidota bacterium]
MMLGVIFWCNFSKKIEYDVKTIDVFSIFAMHLFFYFIINKL